MPAWESESVLVVCPHLDFPSAVCFHRLEALEMDFEAEGSRQFVVTQGKRESSD